MSVIVLVYRLFLTFIFWLAYAGFILVNFLPFLLAALISSKLTKAYARLWAKLPIKVLGLPVTIIGKENIPDYPFVIACNHNSMLDICLALGYFPKEFHFLAKVELFKIPIFGTVLKTLGYFPIARDNPQKALETLKAIGERMHQGANVLIFPEGTRNSGTELLPFKNGMARLACTNNIAVLPVALIGCREVVSPAEKLVKRNPLALKIGKPIKPQDDTRQAMETLNNQVRQQIQELFRG